MLLFQVGFAAALPWNISLFSSLMVPCGPARAGFKASIPHSVSAGSQGAVIRAVAA